MSASRQFPVLVVTGACQVGKTIFLKKVEPGGTGVPFSRRPQSAGAGPEGSPLFLQRFPPPVLIDEIQYAPELLPFLKIYADRTGESGLFWLTGSQPFHLMKGVSESLAGWVGVLHLLGLSRDEQRNAAANAALSHPGRDRPADSNQAAPFPQRPFHPHLQRILSRLRL